MNLTKLLTKLKLFWILAVFILLGLTTNLTAQVCPPVDDISAVAVSSASITFEWEVDPTVSSYSVDIYKNTVMEVVNGSPTISGSTASYTYLPSAPFSIGDELIVAVKSNCSSGGFTIVTETFEFTGVATVEDIYVGSMPEEYTGNCPIQRAPYYIANANTVEGWLKQEVQYCWPDDPDNFSSWAVYKCVVSPNPGTHRTYIFDSEPRICNEESGIGVASGENRKVGIEITDVQLSPNPLVETGVIDFTLNRDTNVSIDITDISGSSLYHKVTEEALFAGRHQVEVNRNELQPGIYLIRIQTSQSIELVKFSIAY